jgi:hypothetical protein
MFGDAGQTGLFYYMLFLSSLCVCLIYPSAKFPIFTTLSSILGTYVTYKLGKHIWKVFTRKPVTTLLPNDYHNVIFQHQKRLAQRDIKYPTYAWPSPRLNLDNDQWIVIMYFKNAYGEKELRIIATSATVEHLEGLILFPPTLTVFKSHILLEEKEPRGFLDDLQQTDYSSYFPTILGQPTRLFVDKSRIYRFEHPLDPRFKNYLWFQESSDWRGGRFIFGPQIEPYQVCHWTLYD